MAESAPAHSEACVAWVGTLIEDELLWPQPLAEAEVIDLGGLTAIGTWVHAWFRARAGQAVVNACPASADNWKRPGWPCCSATRPWSASA
jgi:hypothetical protein